MSTPGPSRRILWLLALYGMGHVVLRLAVSPTLTIDDAREAVLAQTLAWGYLPRQPPFYNWLVWGAFGLLGPGLLALTLVKYLCLVAALLFVYLAARRTLVDPRLAGPAAFSLLLVVPVNWVIHETLTHNVAALAAAAATYWLLLRLLAAGRWRDHVWLGVAIGIGTLSKFNYLFFAAALLLASLSLPAGRDRLLRRRALLGPAVALLMVAPYALWFQARRLSFTAMAAEELRPEVPSYLAGVAISSLYIARMIVYYAVPLVPLFLICFPHWWTARGWARPVTVGPPTVGGELVRRFVVTVLGLLGVGAIAGALTYLKFRWLLPVFFLLPLWLFAGVDGTAIDPGRLRRYTRILVAAELLVAVGIVLAVVRGDRLGRPSQLTVPYDRIARELRVSGFTRGTIVAGEGALAGNLRLEFPTSRVVRITNPDYLPPPQPPPGQCLVVWDREGTTSVPPAIRAWAARILALSLGAEEGVHRATAFYRHARKTQHEVRYVLLPEGRGDCR